MLLVVEPYRILLKQNDFLLSKQLLRSGTRIGANVEVALAGQSRVVFFEDVYSFERSPGLKFLAATAS